ncbi:DUF4913 domain-containing protein [Quadrisphaera sp. INWT6]|uniref:DUF4913 domain-containing protein n=1 Tax=Quadrisphaera sp. INWT6 TaxID=2596917 RepID=UPI0018925889|nr:DUF4913 domain-containing protein [Quadrisphaera sp. INWT6]MBF5083754.1 DUF4913 domain-containing protein [Quadrisphaera sp. INWT6]
MADVNPSDVEEWDDDAGRDGATEDVSAAGAAGQPSLYYPHVGQFVADFLAPSYRRTFDGRSRTWCPAWWQHSEAISRLEALWRAWEYLRREPALGMSTWWRDHADPHMAVLMSAEGPFRHCDAEKGHSERLQPLPLEDFPVDFFSDQ